MDELRWAIFYVAFDICNIHWISKQNEASIALPEPMLSVMFGEYQHVFSQLYFVFVLFPFRFVSFDHD